MARKKRNTNRPPAYSKRQHNLILIPKFRPFDEEGWKELLIAMAYELAKQKKAKHEGDPSDHEDSELKK